MAERLKAKRPIALFDGATSDHPWTKAMRDAAAVRIDMTVACAGTHEGALREVTSEAELDGDMPVVQFAERKGTIDPDLTVGIDVTSAHPLKANDYFLLGRSDAVWCRLCRHVRNNSKP